MLKSRNFLMGLGIGLILSSILLVSLGLTKSTTVDDIKKAASSQNLKVYTAEELNQLKESIRNDLKEEYNSKETVETTDTDKNDSINEQNEANTDKEEYHFTIPDGYHSEEITDILIKSKVLKDADKDTFENILYKENLDTKIIAGQYDIYHIPTVIELVEKITETKHESWPNKIQ